MSERCNRHEAEPAIMVPDDASNTDRLGMLLDGTMKLVRCKNCGMLGGYTNGHQKNGQRRARWYRHGSSWATDKVDYWNARLSALRRT